MKSGVYFGHIDFCAVILDGKNLHGVKAYEPKEDIWMIRTAGIDFRVDQKKMIVQRLDDKGKVLETKKILCITDTHMSFEAFKL